SCLALRSCRRFQVLQRRGRSVGCILLRQARRGQIRQDSAAGNGDRLFGQLNVLRLARCSTRTAIFVNRPPWNLLDGIEHGLKAEEAGQSRAIGSSSGTFDFNAEWFRLTAHLVSRKTGEDGRVESATEASRQ